VGISSLANFSGSFTTKVVPSFDHVAISRLQVFIISYVFRKKMGAFSHPSLLFEDLLERYFVAVGAGEESVKDGTGFDMLRENFDVNTFVGLRSNFFVSCCCSVSVAWIAF